MELKIIHSCQRNGIIAPTFLKGIRFAAIPGMIARSFLLSLFRFMYLGKDLSVLPGGFGFFKGTITNIYKQYCNEQF